MFGLVDRLPLRSQRAPILSADVDNGAAVETEDEGGVLVCVCNKGQEKWGNGGRGCVSLRKGLSH